MTTQLMKSQIESALDISDVKGSIRTYHLCRPLDFHK